MNTSIAKSFCLCFFALIISLQSNVEGTIVFGLITFMWLIIGVVETTVYFYKKQEDERVRSKE